MIYQFFKKNCGYNLYISTKLVSPFRTNLPTVEGLAEQLNVSAHYLGDMLRALTGSNTRQLIQNKIVDRAKELLGTTSLTVAEVAYKLGFEHPQSLNKIFRRKTSMSPIEFKRSLN